MALAYSPTLALRESWVAIYKIYTLKDPFNNQVFYVGQTRQELKTRLSGHLGESRAINPIKRARIDEIVAKGGKPIIEAVETVMGTCYCDSLLINDREVSWIKYYKAQGVNLSNAALMNTDECREYRGYLASIRRGESSYHYYYCGKTYGGHEVYDEEKMKADGLQLPVLEPADAIIIEREVYIERPSVKTVVFPEQPGWSAEFAASIPYSNDDPFELEFDEDLTDWEGDMSDFEPEPLEMWDGSPETKTLEEIDFDMVYSQYSQFLCH